MAKKLFTQLIGAVAGLAMLSGCALSGSGETTTTEKSGGGTAVAEASSGKKVKIGVSIPAADHGWTAGVNWWATRAKDLYPNVDWQISTAENPDKQIKDIETMMAAGVDGMVILATESAPITPVAKQVHERGIFLVSVDRGFLEPVADIFVEGDNKAFGRKSAEYMAEKLGGKGKILILEGIPSTVNSDRVGAFRDVMKRFPGVEILDSQSGMWNKEKALNVTQAMLLKHKQVDAIWASDDDMALGAEQALKEAGRDSVWMLGGAGMKDVIKRVMDKDARFPADITYPPSMIAMGMHLAASSLRDGKQKEKAQFIPKHILLDVELVTPDNAKDFYFADSVY
ncbi:MAG: ABC transporter substrate-binding protein [Fimbriimonadaceae bacterium]|nr:ABC transporter substrate-binding protein [Fimbriimonadaceae bacterium]